MIAVITILSCGIINVIKIEDRWPPWYDAVPLDFYRKAHYRTDFIVSEVYEGLNKIPEDVAVSAESNLVSHLAFREKIYKFPNIEDAEYIIVIPDDRFIFPFLNKKELKNKIQELIDSGEWKEYYQNGAVTILKKTHNS